MPAASPCPRGARTCLITRLELGERLLCAGWCPGAVGQEPAASGAPLPGNPGQCRPLRWGASESVRAWSMEAPPKWTKWRATSGDARLHGGRGMGCEPEAGGERAQRAGCPCAGTPLWRGGTPSGHHVSGANDMQQGPRVSVEALPAGRGRTPARSAGGRQLSAPHVWPSGWRPSRADEVVRAASRASPPPPRQPRGRKCSFMKTYGPRGTMHPQSGQPFISQGAQRMFHIKLILGTINQRVEVRLCKDLEILALAYARGR